jgi:predicted amidohydrolase
MSMVKIAGAQFAGHTDRGKNLDRIARAITEAADHGAQVVCLPS